MKTMQTPTVSTQLLIGSFSLEVLDFRKIQCAAEVPMLRETGKSSESVR